MKSKQNKKISLGDIIKLDFDKVTEKQIIKTLKTRFRVLWFFKLKPLYLNCFKTHHGYHIYIKTNKKIQNKDLVFIQIALGSDFYRECFYWRRIKYPILPNKKWNILFQRKYYNNGTISQEKYLKHLSLKLFKTITKKEVSKNGSRIRRRKNYRRT